MMKTGRKTENSVGQTAGTGVMASARLSPLLPLEMSEGRVGIPKYCSERNEEEGREV